MSDLWEYYYTGIDDQPAGILVDLGVGRDAPHSDLDQVVTLRIQLNRSDEYGFPVEEDIERLDIVEDQLEDGLETLSSPCLYVGRVTVQGTRTLYFYTSDPAAVQASLKSSMEQAPELKFEVASELDAEWSQYFDQLYPSDREQQIIGNIHVLESLQNAGDKPEIPRDVVHWTYFPNAEMRGQFEARAKELGFDVLDQQDQSVGENPFSLCIGKKHTLEEEVIHPLVLELYDLANEHQGEYTGWETAVVRGA